MKLNNFELTVDPGLERADGYVVMQHGQAYRVRLRNLWPRRAEAAVTIDGKPIGTFRLEAQRSTWLERPPNDSGKFTFYLTGTPESVQAGLVEGDPLNGVVQVMFIPEVERPKYVAESGQRYRSAAEQYEAQASVSKGGSGQSASFGASAGSFSDYGPIAGSKPIEGQSMSAGGTGLSGYSGQQFSTVAGLTLDHSQATTISLRLVGPSNEPRPLVAAVPMKANPVPAAIL